ncbi:MAG: HEAT repeat domain-containing protein [Elusimicrobiota bacterium]
MSDLAQKLKHLSKNISGVLLGDSPLKDKVEAAELLGLLGDDNSYHSLFEGLFDSEPEVRSACIYSIVRHNRPDSVPKILEYLQDDSPDVRMAAVTGLGKIADSSIIQYLENLLQQEHISPVREAVSKALNEINSRLNKEEIQRLMEEKFNLTISQKDNEIVQLNEKVKNLEALTSDISGKNALIESEFAKRASKNRKIMSYLLTGFTLFVFLLIAGNFFILRKVFISRKDMVSKETEQLNLNLKAVQESLDEKENILKKSQEFQEKSEEMFSILQKTSKAIRGKNPVAELLFDKVYNKFYEASKLPVEFEKKIRVRETCINIGELIRKKKMDEAIDEFSKLDALIEGLKESSQTPAQ